MIMNILRFFKSFFLKRTLYVGQKFIFPYIPRNPFETAAISGVKILDLKKNHLGELWVKYVFLDVDGNDVGCYKYELSDIFLREFTEEIIENIE